MYESRPIADAACWAHGRRPVAPIVGITGWLRESRRWFMRIGASNSAWIAFGRRVGLRIEHAISIDGWEVCDGSTSWRFFMKQVASLTVIRARCSISVTAREFADKSAARQWV